MPDTHSHIRNLCCLSSPSLYFYLLHYNKNHTTSHMPIKMINTVEFMCKLWPLLSLAIYHVTVLLKKKKNIHTKSNFSSDKYIGYLLDICNFFSHSDPNVFCKLQVAYRWMYIFLWLPWRRLKTFFFFFRRLQTIDCMLQTVRLDCSFLSPPPAAAAWSRPPSRRGAVHLERAYCLH